MQNVTHLFRQLLGRTLYVRLRRNGLTLRHIESGREFATGSDVVFSNSRILVANSTLATYVLKQGVRSILATPGITPVVVMHPLEMVEGGLSEVEEKSLVEIGSEVARQVHVYTGPELSDWEVRLIAAYGPESRKSA
jgi:hypothetical protein